MRRSLSLSLYLLTAGRGNAVAAGTARRMPRPEGSVVWVAASSNLAAQPLDQLCQSLMAEQPNLGIVLTQNQADADVTSALGAPVRDVAPPDTMVDVAAFLDHWKPDAVLLVGHALPPATILACNERQVPVILAGLRTREDAFADGMFRRHLAKSLLPRIDRILVADEAMAVALHDVAGALPGIAVSGHLEAVPQPLSCNEAERASLAEHFGTRGVWLAADCPMDEEAAVLLAHSQAMRTAHRMLLILVPQDISRGAEVADRFTREGYLVALRSNDEEPDAETQIYVADTDGEYGLWYRLAPVTYLAGMLGEHGQSRDPLEAAALGSAIVCGPRPRLYADAFARLSAGKATRTVWSPAALADAVMDLIAPDRAATLAHNAWAVSSSGADVIAKVVETVRAVLDGSSAPRSSSAAR